jgi:hypothetical protein
VTAIRQALGVGDVGQTLEVRGATAHVERVSEDSLLLRVTDPVPGLLAFFAFRTSDKVAVARIAGYLFSPEASAYVAQEAPAWQAWLDELAAQVSG